jgi:predicted metalloprotease with PDZ domain
LAGTIAFVVAAAPLFGTVPVHYHLSFPEPQHRWMTVEVTFDDLPAGPLELRMSRSSPGRYSLHEFAKNVYDVRAFGRDRVELRTERPDPYGWTVPAHDGSVVVRYKVFGDRIDGTYLSIDSTHAHINMPAALMWARGLEDRPAVVQVAAPAGVRWQAATQLFPGQGSLEFAAPNLSYLMDSPIELGPIALRQFTVGDARFRVAVHHDGADGAIDDAAHDIERIVRESGEIFGEYPAYEPGHYTFIVDYLPYANGDAMEHRNSTVITGAGSVGRNRLELLDSVAHEFFHGWNVERIRPASLEPFDLERANMSGELWLGEGFTQYYGPLILKRAGLTDLGTSLSTFEQLITSVVLSPARHVRSAEEMSRMAAFADQGRTIDRTNWSNTYISYYPFGGALALALDLSLRDRTDGRVTLDDYMRAMWRVHGKPGGRQPGVVDRPYSSADAESRLAEVSGDTAFARDFFARFIRGRETPDFGQLVSRAGLLLRKARPGRAWWGEVALDARGGAVRIAEPTAFETPAHDAGLDAGDELQEVGGARVAAAEDVEAAVARRKPGDRLAIVYVDRSRTPKSTTVTLAEDPALELVPVEAAGGTPTPAQRTFRNRWLD